MDPNLNQSTHEYNFDADSHKCFRNVGLTGWVLLLICTSTQTTVAMMKTDYIKDLPRINEVTINFQFISVMLHAYV